MAQVKCSPSYIDQVSLCQAERKMAHLSSKDCIYLIRFRNGGNEFKKIAEDL